MTTRMINNELVFNNNELLNDEQLNSVSGGGGLSLEQVFDIVQELIATGAASAENIQRLVDSHEYNRMSNSQRERALGNCLANDKGFNIAVFGATWGLGVLPTQVKLRAFGVNSKTRELVEKKIRCK